MEEETSWSFTLDGHPPSPNRTHVHWTKKWKEDQLWKQLSAYSVKKIYTGKPLAKARITIVLEYKRRPLKDVDNAFSSVKHPLDGLTAGGIIVDDSPEHIQLIVKQVIGIKKQIHITIEKVDSLD